MRDVGSEEAADNPGTRLPRCQNLDLTGYFEEPCWGHSLRKRYHDDGIVLIAALAHQFNLEYRQLLTLPVYILTYSGVIRSSLTYSMPIRSPISEWHRSRSRATTYKFLLRE